MQIKYFYFLLMIFILFSCEKQINNVQYLANTQILTNSKINRYIAIELKKEDLQGYKMKDIMHNIEYANKDSGEKFSIVDIYESTNETIIFILDRYSKKDSRNYTTPVIIPIYLYR